MSRVRLPWKRGPRAWDVACCADQVLARLSDSPRAFLSLRKAAAHLGVSTQPLRDWIRLGYLRRDGPRQQVSTRELSRFVVWLSSRAERYDMEFRLNRIHNRRPELRYLFCKLSHSRFAWPKGRTALTPTELAGLIGCHPSLIRLAIRRERVRGRHPTPGRWEITRRAWSEAFPLTLR